VRWRAAIATGQPFEMEFPLRGADGKFRAFLTRVQPLKDSQGSVVQWFGTNTDVDELKRMEESLRETQARLNSTLAAGSIGTWTWDIVNDRLAADEFTARMFSIEVDAAAKGLPAAAYLQVIHEEDRPGVEDALARAIESCGPYDIEYRVRQRDGGFRWLQARGRVEGDAAGNALNFHGAVMDITERKQAEEEVRRLNEDLEQRVAQRTAELEAANKELEAFSYSVSHDLRAPLRHINGFSQALLEDYEDKLDDAGKNYLHQVRGASQEMAQLIDDVLQLARVTRAEMRREPINLSEVARTVITDLRKGDKDRSVVVEIEEGLAIQGDKRLMQVMLINLLGNAWKFTSKREQAEIAFGQAKQNGQSVYFVRDNGPGFDMAYVGKLFSAFQRLHTTSEFEGTGIGLATVQRIVNRHGGRVWAEGKLNEGATFYFTLQGSRELDNGE
jgi:signal transduction histidine kinase